MLEKYAVASYGAKISTVGDLLPRVHKVHAAMGHRASARVVTDEETCGLVYCYSCHLPGVTVRSCPICKPPARNTRNPPGRILDAAESRAEDPGSGGTMTFGGVLGHGPPDSGNVRGVEEFLSRQPSPIQLIGFRLVIKLSSNLI